MARKKKEEQGGGGSPAWMATFSDLMNLLLCFFVLLFSMSSIDAAKFEQVVASLASSFSIFSTSSVGVGQGDLISNGVEQLDNLGEYFQVMENISGETEEEITSLEQYKEHLEEEKKEQIEELYEEISDQVESNKLEQYVSVGMDENYQYVKISMYGAILFDSGKADIKEEALPILKKIGAVLKIYDDYQIKIEGHTDNVPITSNTTYKNNMWLSTARASTVWEFLTEESGLDAKTLESSGRSEYEPVADNSTEEGRKKNRRVEIKIYSDINE